MVHIKPTVLVITLKISDQNAPIKRQKLSELIKKTRPSYTFVYELGWPKSLFRFFCNIVWKSLNEFLANPVPIRDRETLEIVTDFILGGSKITADGEGSHEIKRRLFFGRKAMTNPAAAAAAKWL